MSKSRFTLATLPLALTLAACSGGGGGGGGSDDEDDGSVVSGEPAATVEVERVSLTGLAIKGLARGALIELFPLDSSTGSFSSTAIASGTTDANGLYQLDFEDGNLPSGVVKIVLSYQDGAELQCDNVNSGDTGNDCIGPLGGVALGEFYPMPESFEMVSIANFDSSVVDENGARIINITALSSLASGLLTAYSDSSLSYEEKVLKAVAQIKAILGMPSGTDLTGDTPDNLVNEGDEGDAIYGALNAAFIRIAKQRGESVEEVIQAFISAINSDAGENETGQIRWKSSTDANTLDALITAAEEFNTSADLSDIRGEIDGAVDDGYTAKVPPVVSLGTNLTLAPGDTTELKATAVDGITAETTYQWITDAPNTALSSTSATQSFTAPQTEGNYRVGVRVTNTDSLSSTSAVTISVKAPTVIGSALDGDYHMIFSARRLEQQNDGSQTHLLRAEMEDGGVMTIGTGSEGTIVYEASGFSAVNHRFEANLSSTDAAGLNSEIENYAGDGIQLKVGVKANGLASIDVPKSTELNITDNVYYIEQANTLRFIPVGKDNSLMFGFAMADSEEYGLINGQPDLTDLKYNTREAMNILLARKNSINGSAVMAGADYRGFEIEFGSSGYGYIESSMYDMQLTFDNSGVLSATEALNVQLNSQVPSSGSLMMYQETTPTPDVVDYNFVNGRYVFDEEPAVDDTNGTETGGSHGSVLAAADGSALMVQSIFWENNVVNDPTDTAFTSSLDPWWRSSNIGVYVKTPEQAINLDGMTFSVGVQGFYSLMNAQNAYSFGIRGEYGTVSFSGSTMTLTLTGKQVAVVPDDTGTGQDYSKPATATTRTLTIPVDGSLTTGTDGCATIVQAVTDSAADQNGTYVCTDGDTLIVRHYSTTSDTATESTRYYMGLMVGTKVD